MTDSNPVCPDNLSELIASQVNFGLVYVREARSAYGQGRYDYADLARQIAMNAYSTATRFAARLRQGEDAAVLNDVARFKYEVENLLPEAVTLPFIA